MGPIDDWTVFVFFHFIIIYKHEQYFSYDKRIKSSENKKSSGRRFGGVVVQGAPLAGLMLERSQGILLGVGVALRLVGPWWGQVRSERDDEPGPHEGGRSMKKMNV